SGAAMRIAPTTITVDFNDLLLQTSVSAADLNVDGVSATGFTIVDADTVTFNLPAGLAQGNHTVTIAAGDISDIQSTPISAYSGSFFIDSIGPRVIGTSIAPGGVALPGAVTYQVTFDEPMLASNLSADDFTLHGNLRNANYSAASFSFN